METKKFYEAKTIDLGEEKYYEISNPLLKSLKDERIREVKQAINDFVKGKVIADIGCGEGYITLNYAKSVKKVFCSDISGNALKKARKNLEKAGIRNFETKEADGTRTGFKNGQFDAVLCCSALDHVPNPIKMLQELARITKKGGNILIELDNDILPLFSGIRINKKMLDNLGHFNRITYRKLGRMMAMADIPVQRIKVYSWGSPFRFYYRLIKYFPFLRGILDWKGKRFPSVCYEYLAVYRKV